MNLDLDASSVPTPVSPGDDVDVDAGEGEGGGARRLVVHYRGEGATRHLGSQMGGEGKAGRAALGDGTDVSRT